MIDRSDGTRQRDTDILKRSQTPYLVPVAIVYLWLFRRVTDSLQNGCLASVRPPDDEDSKTAKLFPDVFEIACVLVRHACVLGALRVNKSTVDSPSVSGGGQDEE